MNFWDEFKTTASEAFESKKSEISGFLGNAISGIVKNAATPVPGNPTIQPAPVIAAAAVPNVLMYALPAAIVLGALILYRRK